MESWKNIFYLFKTLRKKRKIQIIFLMISSLLSGILEAFSLASFLPFLSVLINPNDLINIPIYDFFNLFIDTDSSKNFLLPLALIFITLTFITASIRLLNLWYAAKISALVGSDIGVKVYEKCLYQPYIKQLMTNSSTIINAVTYQSPNVMGVFYSANFVITSFFVAIFIIFGLLTLDIKLTISIFILISIIYFFISFKIRKLLIKNSKIIDKFGKKQIQSLQEGIGLIRDIILENSQSIFVERYKFYDKELNIRKSQSKFYATFPRFFLETAAIVFLSVIALIISSFNNQESSFIPIFGAYALGSQKLISAAQQIYANWSNIESKSEDIYRILSIVKNKYDLEKKIYESVKPFILKNSIDINNVNFSYTKNKKHTLKNINLSIKKGQKIAFIGRTGSGKSTLVDLIMGLIVPLSGDILVDGKILNNSNNSDSSNLISWRKAISHVPQSIFLADASFAENIALGIPMNKINFDLVKSAAEIACIHNFIEESPKSYNGLVGERGIRLSGGQRQRIGIARAIYKQPKILILDEATSALDNKTEEKVMNLINLTCSEMTIIMIAHRYSSIKGFDRVLKIENGQIISDDTPNKVLSD